MTFQQRVVLLPALAGIFLSLILAVAGFLGTRNAAMLERIELGHGPALELHRDLEALLAEAQRGLQDGVAAEDLEALARVGRQRETLQRRIAEARENPVLDRAKLGRLERDFLGYLEHASVTSARLVKKEGDVVTELETMRSRYVALRDELERETEASRRAMAGAFTEGRVLQRDSLAVMLVLIFAAVSVLGVLAVRTTRQVLGPLAKLTAAANRIAVQGDLTAQIEVERDDEIGQLARAFSEMLSQLRELRFAIEGSVHRLAAAAAEIHASAQEQEAASQMQSSGAEQVNRTMQSLLESARHIADSAGGVFTNAERTKLTSASTAQKIGELSAHTGRMVEILEVIREIAERSDLLALNASLEGTRAGEAGRGFSLVANEMRRLSERVGASVQDVKVLVTDIRASGASTVMVTEEARKLAEGTAESAKQITLVTQQQQTATELVSRSMKDVAEALVQTVAANRQTIRAAVDLKSEAERLSTLVGRFRVEGRAG